jgi:hypothetical protein
VEFSDLIIGTEYEVYSNEDDSLILVGKLVSVTQEGIKFENYFLPSSDYEKIYIV